MRSGHERARYQYKLPTERRAQHLPAVALKVYSSHPGSRISANLLNIHGLNFSTRHTSAIGGFARFLGCLCSSQVTGRKSQTAGVPQFYSQHPEIRIWRNSMRKLGLSFSNRNTSAISRYARLLGRTPSSHVTGRRTRVAAHANCATLNKSRLLATASKWQPAGESLCAE